MREMYSNFTSKMTSSTRSIRCSLVNSLSILSRACRKNANYEDAKENSKDAFRRLPYIMPGIGGVPWLWGCRWRYLPVRRRRTWLPARSSWWSSHSPWVFPRRPDSPSFLTSLRSLALFSRRHSLPWWPTIHPDKRSRLLFMYENVAGYVEVKSSRITNLIV